MLSLFSTLQRQRLDSDWLHVIFYNNQLLFLEEEWIMQIVSVTFKILPMRIWLQSIFETLSAAWTVGPFLQPLVTIMSNSYTCSVDHTLA